MVIVGDWTLLHLFIGPVSILWGNSDFVLPLDTTDPDLCIWIIVGLNIGGGGRIALIAMPLSSRFAMYKRLEASW